MEGVTLGAQRFGRGRREKPDSAAPQYPAGMAVRIGYKASAEQFDPRTLLEYARQAEEVGLDVYATGEHHNPPFVPSSPTTLLGYIAARTSKILLSTSTTLITTNDPVKIAE